MEVKERVNFRKLSNGMYLVRTQAGFKQAVKQFHGESNDDMFGYPKSYPSVVEFYQDHGYNNYAVCRHLNEYKKHLADLVEDLKDE